MNKKLYNFLKDYKEIILCFVMLFFIIIVTVKVCVNYNAETQRCNKESIREARETCYKYTSNYDFKIDPQTLKLYCNDNGKAVEVFWNFDLSNCLTKEDVDIK